MLEITERSTVVLRGKVNKKKLVGDAEQQALIKGEKDDSPGGEKVLGTIQIPGLGSNQWHNLKLRFEGTAITGLVDGKPVLTVSDSLYSHGMVGLVACGGKRKCSTPYYDNLLVNRIYAPVPEPSSADSSRPPIYGQR